jgi:hypothetical protein
VSRNIQKCRTQKRFSRVNHQIRVELIKYHVVENRRHNFFINNFSFFWTERRRRRELRIYYCFQSETEKFRFIAMILMFDNFLHWSIAVASNCFEMPFHFRFSGRLPFSVLRHWLDSPLCLLPCVCRPCCCQSLGVWDVIYFSKLNKMCFR